MAGWVKDTTSGKADNYNYLDDAGNKATNVWKQDSTGKWAYLNDTGDWAKNTVAKDSNGWQSIGSDGYWTGKSVAPDYNTSVSSKLTLPTYKAYNPKLNMSDYISQADTLLTPQWEVTQQILNDNNAANLKASSNDMLKRGLARSSDVLTRADTINNQNAKNIANAKVAQNANVNSLASTNYTNAWNQGYQLNNDLNNFNQADYTNKYNLYNNAYNADVGNYQWKTNRDDTLNQNTIDNNYRNTVFDYNKAQDAQNYALALKKSNSSGGSGGSSGGSSTTKSSSTSNIKAVQQGYSNMIYGQGQTKNADGSYTTAEQNALTVLRNKKSAMLNDLVEAGMTGKDALNYYEQIQNDLTGN